ncbi:WH2 motif domain-containing protein [Ditylenchus destructor]|uniref:WH2 motif domain-containing protein n=1 Tax=Ditylenchus destructor TaxID=166010 RepID=A0AAD4QYV3_9BILA|nr:WH2 motif domain-containing protein [Ditylenchus destructor]
MKNWLISILLCSISAEIDRRKVEKRRNQRKGEHVLIAAGYDLDLRPATGEVSVQKRDWREFGPEERGFGQRQGFGQRRSPWIKYCSRLDNLLKEGDSKAYESVEVDKSAQNRRSSAPSPYLHDENRQSETPASQNANSSRLSPNVMTQSYYSASDMDESDLLDGLSLDDEDAARLLEEFEVDEYDDAARRARSATPYGSSSAPVKKKKIIVKKKIVKKASESTPDKKSASTSNLASDKKICTGDIFKINVKINVPKSRGKIGQAYMNAVQEKKSASPLPSYAGGQIGQKYIIATQEKKSLSPAPQEVKNQPAKTYLNTIQDKKSPSPAPQEVKNQPAKTYLSTIQDKKSPSLAPQEVKNQPAKTYLSTIQDKKSPSPAPQEVKNQPAKTYLNTIQDKKSPSPAPQEVKNQPAKTYLSTIQDKKSPSPAPQEVKNQLGSSYLNAIQNRTSLSPVPAEVKNQAQDQKSATNSASAAPVKKSWSPVPQKAPCPGGISFLSAAQEKKSPVPVVQDQKPEIKNQPAKPYLSPIQDKKSPLPVLQEVKILPAKSYLNTIQDKKSISPAPQDQRPEIKNQPVKSYLSTIQDKKSISPAPQDQRPEIKNQPAKTYLSTTQVKKSASQPPALTQNGTSKPVINGIQDKKVANNTSGPAQTQNHLTKPQITITEANKAYGSQTLEKKPEEKASPWGTTLERQPRKNEKKVSGPNSLPAPQEKPRSRTPTPAELKYGKLNDPTPRDALLDTIAKGGFKLKHVETNDKSSGVLKPPEQESRSSSVPPAPKLEAPKPPPLNRAPSPAQLKFSDPEPSARQALLNAINAGGFKLRKVETNDRSGLVVDDDERKARSSSQPAPPPPPPGLGQPPAMNRAPSPAVLKHGKGEASARDELFNAINAGGFKLRKVETKDKSGLIVDDEMKASACKIVENQVAPPPPPPMPVKKAPPAPTPPPPPPAAQKAPKVSKPITNPKLLKLGGKDAQVNRAELLNTIKTGGFKLRKVEILDKSAPVLVENQDVATVSSSGYVSVAAPAPPPPPPPPAPGGPRKPKEVTNPAVLKLAKRSGKDVKPDIEALFKSIKSGGIKLRKVETNDKSGLILDDQQMAKKAQAETSSDAVPEAEPEKELPSQENGTEVKKKIKKTKIKVIKKAPA